MSFYDDDYAQAAMEKARTCGVVYHYWRIEDLTPADKELLERLRDEDLRAHLRRLGVEFKQTEPSEKHWLDRKNLDQ